MRRFSKTRLLTLGLAVILMAFAMSALALPGKWTPQQFKTSHQLTGTSAATAPGTGLQKRGPGQAPAFKLKMETPAMKEFKRELKEAGLKPWQLPKVHFKGPAYKMLVKAALKAGVPVSKAIQDNPKSLCDENGYWLAGPSIASATNGNAIVWGGGQNIYFASTSDPTHPLVLPWDYIMRIWFKGNTALVLGYFGEYAFDVTNPTQPAFLGYDLAGMDYGMIALGMTADDQYIVGAMNGDDVVAWDSGFNYISDWTLEDLGGSFPYTPELTDMTIPDGSSVAIITDWDNDYIHFVNFADLDCSNPTYRGYIDDTVYGWDDCGMVMYQAPFLYTNYEPWWVYNPYVGGNCPDNEYWMDLFKVPDLMDPSTSINVKAVSQNNYGLDIVAMHPTGEGNGNIALGFYNGQVATWDAQLNNIQEFGNFGEFSADTTNGNFGLCEGEYATLDMGWSPTFVTTANWAGGARFGSAPAPIAETGHYMTGDYAYNAMADGSTIYCPEYVDGLALVDNSDPTNPQTLGWLPTTSGLPFIGLVAAEGDTAYVAGGDDPLYGNSPGSKVFAVDVSDPANPAYLSSSSTAYDVVAAGYGTTILSIYAHGGICWIGTDTSLVGVSFANPSSPQVVANFTLQSGSTGAYGMSAFTMPAFPQSTMLAVAAGPNIEIYDITTPVQYSGCPTPYFFVASMAMPTSPSQGNTTSIFASGSYLIFNDTGNNDVDSVLLTANIGSACAVNEITLPTAPTFQFDTSSVVNSPDFLAYAGTVGGRVVGAVSDASSGNISTFDITDPTNMDWLNSPAQVVDGYTSALFFSNGALYYGIGWAGLGNYILEPGFVAPKVNSVTASPAIGGHLNGTVTLTANVTASDSAVTEVDFNYGGNLVAEVPTSIGAGTTADVTYTWDTSEWTFYPCAGYVSATAYDSGCNEDTNSSTASYNVDLAPTVTLSNWDPAIPAGGGVCGPAPGAWVVCGTITFTAMGTDGACNLNPGISQMSEYIDGDFVSYINNPNDNGTEGEWDITLDTATLADGDHTITVTATDAQGLTGTVTSAGFTVHNVGPTTTVTDPVAGEQVLGGSETRVAAETTSNGSDLMTDMVKFWLDMNTPQQALIGTATSQDENGEYAITWDTTGIPYGNHTITAVGYDGGGTVCPASGMSPLVSFRITSYQQMAVSATATPSTGTAPLSVLVTTTVTGGTAPYTYSIDFDDGTTAPGASASVSHTYSTAGTYNVVATVTDSTNTSVSSTPVQVVISVTPPVITLVKKKHHTPFRLKVSGSNFQVGLNATIAGTSVTYSYKSSAKIVLKKHIKSLCPKGVAVPIVITNPDGGVSNTFMYTR